MTNAPRDVNDFTLSGHAGALHARSWTPGAPRWIALLCHGYGEHLGRYPHVAERLAAEDAAVYAVDHVGHGRSAGERVLIADYEQVVSDLHLLAERAILEHPGLPVVLIGHSMGGMIAARYTQRYGGTLSCVVLSGPVLGRWAAVDDLAGVPDTDIPDDPIDPSTLSRDPAVGEAYVADPLVWHGPFRATTVAGIRSCMATITEAGQVTVPPMLWLHGGDDALVPYDGSAIGWASLAGPTGEHGHRAKVYPGARHEIFNETNADEVLGDVVDFVEDHLPPAGESAEDYVV